MPEEKMWGDEPFWGLGYEWDPDWTLTDRQKELRATLIGLCEQEMRANAKRSDDELLYPRRNLELMGEHGFLALTVPEEHGGLGENHVAFSMVCETLARYGCASTAMCYVMHLAAVNTIMLRPTDELIEKYIRPLNGGKLGTLSYSDPETGSHFWYPFSSGAERSNGGYKVRKKASWTTSGGFADFYVVQTTSPEFSGYDDLSVFVIDGEDVKAQPSLWDALGLRGNQSGPIEVDNVEIPGDQIVGPVGDGAASNDEAVDPWFLIGSSSVWNGITLGAIDIAKRHTTRKRHVDVGMRVADYPTIQDYIGEAVMDTNACRLFVTSVAQAMDWATENNTKQLQPGEFARADFLHWAWQIKFEAAKNTAHHVDKMLHACGGSGYKRDMELERYVRDAKAGWVMGPTNEVLRQFVGKAVLLGFDALDYWNQTYNRRVVENEVKKLDVAGKRELAEQLMAQAEKDEAKSTAAAT
jgi:alkylation response protein AidB-like acyl-CoA dehydrogenase